jgi:hypothetical protein
VSRTALLVVLSALAFCRTAHADHRCFPSERRGHESIVVTSFPVKGPLRLSLGVVDAAPRTPCVQTAIAASVSVIGHDVSRAFVGGELRLGRHGLGLSFETFRRRIGDQGVNERGDLWLGWAYQLPLPFKTVLAAPQLRLQAPTASLGARYGGELGLGLGIPDMSLYAGLALTAPVDDLPGDHDNAAAVGVFAFTIEPWLGTRWFQPIVELHAHIGRVRRLGPMGGFRLYEPTTGLTLSAAGGYMFGEADGPIFALTLAWYPD